MFDFKSTLLPSELKYRFSRIAGTKDKWLIQIPSLSTSTNGDNEFIEWIHYGEYIESTDRMSLAEDINKFDCTELPSEYEVKQEFIRFRELCPIYTAGQEIDSSLLIYSDNSEELKQRRNEVFDKLLTGISILLYGETTGINYAKRCIKCLRNTNFYDLQAPTEYRNSKPGDLLRHTLGVVNEMIKLTYLPAFNTVNIPKIMLNAMVPDWNKIIQCKQ